ncbi:hypothetical protein PG993_001387 [Apiospora rasikravindrae]|uniref:Uncharacterized protein n=1 Tax=Apiospora rasikravindrae TaxID=990691 RepID=A0ABR1UBA0_9PEZI
MMARRHVPQPLPLADESHLTPNSNDHLSESIVSPAGVSPVSSSSASSQVQLHPSRPGLRVRPSAGSTHPRKPSKPPQGQYQSPISTEGQQAQPSQSEPSLPAAALLPSSSHSQPNYSQDSQATFRLPRSKYQARPAITTSPPEIEDDDDDDFEDDYHRYQQHQAKNKTTYPAIEEPPPPNLWPREDLSNFQFASQPISRPPSRPSTQPSSRPSTQPAPQLPSRSTPFPTLPQQQHQQQSSAREAEKHSRNGSRFFNFSKGPKAGNLHPGRHRSPSRSQNYLPVDTPDDAASRDIDVPSMSDRVSSKASKHSDHSSVDPSVPRDDQSLPSRSDASLASGATENEQLKNNPNPFTRLNRSRSVKDKDKETPRTKDMASTSTQVKIQEPERAHTLPVNNR